MTDLSQRLRHPVALGAFALLGAALTEGFGGALLPERVVRPLAFAVIVGIVFAGWHGGRGVRWRDAILIALLLAAIVVAISLASTL